MKEVVVEARVSCREDEQQVFMAKHGFLPALVERLKIVIDEGLELCLLDVFANHLLVAIPEFRHDVLVGDSIGGIDDLDFLGSQKLADLGKLL